MENGNTLHIWKMEIHYMFEKWKYITHLEHENAQEKNGNAWEKMEMLKKKNGNAWEKMKMLKKKK